MRLRRTIMVAAALVVVVPGVPAGAVAPDWTLGQAMLPQGALADSESGFGGIDCPAANTCVLVGQFPASDGAGGTRTVGLLETVQGSRIVPTTAPLPTGVDVADDPRVQLTDVSCSAPGACVAVGSYSSSDGRSHPFAETLADGVWTSDALTAPGGSAPANGELRDVDCSATTCVAVGSYTDLAPSSAPLVEVRSAGTWSASRVTTGFSGYASAVDCPGSGTCAAVGVVDGSPSLLYPGGGGWRSVNLPAPSGAPQSSIDPRSISCTSTGNCLALSTYGSNARRVVAEVLTDGALAAVRVPVPRSQLGRSLAVNAATCPAAGECVGAGVAFGAPDRAVLFRLTGGSWSSLVAPRPATAQAGGASSLAALSCASATSCVAVGSVDRRSFHSSALARPLIDTLAGSTWTAAGLGRPAGVAGDVSDQLTTVGCTAARCVAAGQYQRYRPDGAVAAYGVFVARRR